MIINHDSHLKKKILNLSLDSDLIFQFDRRCILNVVNILKATSKILLQSIHMIKKLGKRILIFQSF